MTPRFQIYDTYSIGKRSWLVLHIGYGTIDITENILCYHTYDFDRRKVAVYAVEGVDKRAR